MIETLTAAEIVAASGGDRYAMVAVANGTVGEHAWAADGAVVWTSSHRGGPSFSGVGAPAAVAGVLASVAEQVPDAGRASLPRGWTDTLPPSLAASDLSHWDWMWTATAPPAGPGEDSVRWLDQADDDAVRALLTEVSPGASAWPGDGRSRRWAGVTDASGTLVACLADTSRSAAVGNVSSVAVVHRARRKGYGRALVTWTTRQLLAEGCSTVTLGMYADNEAARAMYLALGFHCDHTFTGAVLTRTPAHRPRSAPAASPPS